MSKAHTFERDEVYPSYFVNALQEIISSGRLDFQLSRKTDTTVQVIPDPAFGLAGMNIEGRWRWNEETVERIHPGGSAGTYDIWATATDDDVDDIPDPKTDHTDRSFDLAITDGSDPATAIFVKVGELDWDGAAITALRQTYGVVSGAMLGDDVLAAGDLTWTRQPGGGFLANIADGAVTSREFKPTSGVAVSNGSPTLTVTPTTPPACEVTLKPPVASYLDIIVAIDYGVSFNATELILRSQMYKNGSAVSGSFWSLETEGFDVLGSVTYPCRVDIDANEEADIELRLWKATNVGTAFSTAGVTRFSYQLRAQ